MKKHKADESYDVIFSNQALSKLKDLAKYYEKSDEDLADVVIKGIQVLDIAKKFKTSTLYVQDAPNSVKKINLKAS